MPLKQTHPAVDDYDQFTMKGKVKYERSAQTWAERNHITWPLADSPLWAIFVSEACVEDSPHLLPNTEVTSFRFLQSLYWRKKCHVHVDKNIWGYLLDDKIELSLAELTSLQLGPSGCEKEAVPISCMSLEASVKPFWCALQQALKTLWYQRRLCDTNLGDHRITGC